MGVLILRHLAARTLGNYCGIGEIVPLCTYSSLMAKWTYAFGAQSCIVSSFLLPSLKIEEIDAVLITLKLITLALALRRVCGALEAHGKRSLPPSLPM